MLKDRSQRRRQWAWIALGSAHDSKRTYIAAALLVTAHYAFWRIGLDKVFRNPALF